MPAEMPDGTLRIARRRRSTRVNNTNTSFGEQSAGNPPSCPCGGRELAHVKIDRAIGVNRIQMDVMKAGAGA